MLSCNIVRDLLPSYLRHLTSPETDAEILEHLQQCKECQRMAEVMVSEPSYKKAWRVARNFFKAKPKYKFGIARSVAIAVLCLYGIYSMDYSVDATNTASLEAAADKALHDYGFTSEFTESIRLGRMLFVQFKNIGNGEEDKQGILQLEQGIFGKYRIICTDYSEWVLYFNKTVKVGSQDYLMISGVNEPVGADTFRLYWNDLPQCFTRKSSCVTNENFEPIFKGRTKQRIFLLKEISKGNEGGIGWPFSIRYYDEDGRELDLKEISAKYEHIGKMQAVSEEAKAPMSLYFFLGIVVWHGILVTRYFISSKKRQDDARDQKEKGLT